MRYALIGCEVLNREFMHASLISEAAIDLIMLPQGLHLSPGELRARVQQEINRIESPESRKAAAGPSPLLRPEYDAILLGYGLCSNGVAGIQAGVIPLVIPRGHDCLTLLLGSMAAYKEHFDNRPGTYWYSSGWIERALQPGPQRHAAMMKHYTEKYGEEKARALVEIDSMQYAAYKYAAYINWNLSTADHDRRYTKECAEFMGWEYTEVQGDPALMIDFIEGNWDEARFLKIAPGEKIEPSNDDCILKACR